MSLGSADNCLSQHREGICTVAANLHQDSTAGVCMAFIVGNDFSVIEKRLKACLFESRRLGQASACL